MLYSANKLTLTSISIKCCDIPTINIVNSCCVMFVNDNGIISVYMRTFAITYRFSLFEGDSPSGSFL